MAFPVIGGTQESGYNIDNSLRFDDGDSAVLKRTAGANTGEDNATISFWFKLGNSKSANNGGTIMANGGTSGTHVIQLYAQKIYIGSANFAVMFPNLIRDPSAWYHLFIAFDTSQGTNTNRVKAYLNGVILTDAVTPNSINLSEFVVTNVRNPSEVVKLVKKIAVPIFLITRDNARTLLPCSRISW